jgi:hypothetical protein
MPAPAGAVDGLGDAVRSMMDERPVPGSGGPAGEAQEPV